MPNICQYKNIKLNDDFTFDDSQPICGKHIRFTSIKRDFCTNHIDNAYEVVLKLRNTNVPKAPKAPKAPEPVVVQPIDVAIDRGTHKGKTFRYVIENEPQYVKYIQKLIENGNVISETMIKLAILAQEHNKFI